MTGYFLASAARDSTAGWNSTQIVLFIFGAMLLGAVLCTVVYVVNRRLARRDMKVLGAWLERDGNRVEAMEWVLYPSKKFWFRRSLQFDVRFLDSANQRHQAIAAVPAWGDPVLIENNIIGAPSEPG